MERFVIKVTISIIPSKSFDTVSLMIDREVYLVKKKFVVPALVGILAVASLATYMTFGVGESKANAQYTIEPKVTQENGKTVKTFDLVAKETDWKLNKDTEVKAWAYNGVVPGSQIRVKQGDLVRVNLKNELKELTSIHWHGYPVPNQMDGIPGVTQNSLRTGESYTYEFEAKIPGTYWYHSHQESANQVDKGLYGTLVVEGADESQYQRDYTLVLDEWTTANQGMDHEKMDGHGSTQGTAGMDHGSMNNSNHNMAGMDHGSMNMQGANTDSTHMDSNMPVGKMHDEMMKTMYSIFTVNGKSGEAIEPLEMAKGEKVRLRFVNAGFQSHILDFNDQEYTIISTDGQEITNPTPIKGSPFVIAPGERYDIELVANSDANWFITSKDDSDAAKQMIIPVQLKDAKTTAEIQPASKDPQPIDITTYGRSEPAVSGNTKAYDVAYEMLLGEKTGENAMDPKFTINGKAFPDIAPLTIKKGDKVKVTLTNQGSSNHPMHLHGHFFQVLSKDGKALTGSPLVKDTLNIKPGESYVVEFVADNPGDWMFHCHDLHHAAAGMVTSVHYDGYPSFTPDPSIGNKGD